MHSIFECLVDGIRHLGVVEAPLALPLLYRLEEPLVSTLAKNAAGDLESVVRDICSRRAESAGSFELLAPLRPKQDTMLFVSGFGLTHTSKMPAALHKGRASGREVAPAELPFWFLKGFAGSLRLPGDTVRVGSATVGICEEAELVLAYSITPAGLPRYLGYTFGNDFTDIERFRRNKSQLSYCKLYDSGVLPQLYLGPPPSRVDGTTTVYRAGKLMWSTPFETGIERIFFDVEQMLDYMWQHVTILVPGSVHLVYIGADRNTTDFGFQMVPGDVVELDFGKWGKLANRIEAVATGHAAPPFNRPLASIEAEV